MKLRQLSFANSEFDAILQATHDDPFAFLGPHEVEGHWLVRVFAPAAQEVTLINTHPDKDEQPFDKVHAAGLFEVILPEGEGRPTYQLRLTYPEGQQTTMADPYSFGPILGELDLHLFSEGNHHRLYDKLGAHLCTVDGVVGCTFAVWAPNARRVSVVGDFNGWDGRVNPMRKLLSGGVWEIFLPGIAEGAHYKFEVLAANGGVQLKSDPFAFYNPCWL